MATSVTVDAKCAKGKEILISFQKNGALVSRQTLQNGESTIAEVDKVNSVSIMEREKQPEPEKEVPEDQKTDSA